MVGAILAGASLATSAITEISNIVEGGKRERAAIADIEGYDRQDLKNVTSGMSVPTEGYRLRSESIARGGAEAISSASKSGARGVAFAGDIFQQIQASQADLSAQLEQQEFQMKQIAMEDEARIRGMQEQREREDLQALGVELEAGRSQRDAGFDALTQTLASGATVAASGGFDGFGDIANNIEGLTLR